MPAFIRAHCFTMRLIPWTILRRKGNNAMNTKIVIYVDGGTVQTVFTDGDPDQFEVELVDFDNLEAEGRDRVERETMLKNAAKGMSAIF